ncbi:MAG: TRAP transporter large permease subunit [Paracoccaceae bacterium]|nr:TRAP transporter large permease subunit [Paracoccaceae bacterium]
MTTTLLGVAGLLMLLFYRVPLGFAMLIVGYIGYGLLRGFGASAEMVSLQILEMAINFSFSVLPLFILMGVFVSRSGLADDLYTTCYRWLGHMKGGLAITTIAACAGFSAVSGSSLATAATMTKVSFPAMRKFKYNESLACGTIAAGGTLGILIPPSNALIVYGILTQTDIAKLFMGAILPGILTVLIYILVVVIVVHLFPNAGPPGERSSWRERIVSLGKIWGIAVLFLFIIGGIFLGFFTPSEAGGMGAVGALAFAVGRGKLNLRQGFEALIEAGRTTALLFTVSFGALILNQFFNVAGLQDAMAGFISGLNFSPNMTLVMILAVFVLLGMVVEGFAIIFLTVPIFVPIIQSLGFDLIWFGVLMVMLIEVSLITPPIGLNVFVIKSMLPEVPLASIFRGIVPFFLGDIVRLLIVAFLPWMVLYLPSLM